MGELTLYPLTEGGTSRLEYDGAAGEVVAVTTYAIFPAPELLAALRLAALGDVPLATLGALASTLSAIQLALPIVLFTNSNGFAHAVLPTAGQSAGTVILAAGEVLVT